MSSGSSRYCTLCCETVLLEAAQNCSGQACARTALRGQLTTCLMGEKYHKLFDELCSAAFDQASVAFSDKCQRLSAASISTLCTMIQWTMTVCALSTADHLEQAGSVVRPLNQWMLLLHSLPRAFNTIKHIWHVSA